MSKSNLERVSDSFSANRLPPPATQDEAAYRREQKIKAACYMVKKKAAGQPDLVEMLGLDEVLSGEQREGLQRLIAARAGGA